MGKSVEREGNVELRLDLSMGGSFTRAPDDKNPSLLPPSSGVFPDHCGVGFQEMYCRNKEEAEEILEQRRRKEVHALRRQAARKKRDEKRGALKRSKQSPQETGDNNDGSVQTVVPLMQYVVQNGDKVEYIPVTPGSAFPYVVPYWPASSPPPILTRNSDPVAATASWCDNVATKRLRESDSGESSSSVVSDKNRGGSSSASSHPHLEQSGKDEGNEVDNGNQSEKSCPAAIPPSTAGEKQLKLPQMPCVSTTGDGPNGKTISGFLYRYTKGEVSIVCVCHGESFSPAEFVKHAGGTDVEHPMRHIIIVPSPGG